MGHALLICKAYPQACQLKNTMGWMPWLLRACDGVLVMDTDRVGAQQGLN